MDRKNEEDTPRPPDDVAMWHRLSGLPDNVTDDGEVVSAHAGQRAQIAKDQLRAEIARLRAVRDPSEVAALARLAASYLLAGDVETARRYVSRAQELLSSASGATSGQP
jgi:hypothetical protein